MLAPLTRREASPPTRATSLALALGLAIALVALPLAAAQEEVDDDARNEFVAAEHVFAFALADEQPVAGVPQTLLIDIFDNATGIPTGGLLEALTLTLVHGDASRTFPLSESDEVVGQYIARFLPTESGNYTARLTGSVNATEVEIVAPLPTVVGADALQFPTPAIEARIEELETRIEENKGIPAGGAVLASAALALVALAARVAGGRR